MIIHMMAIELGTFDENEKIGTNLKTTEAFDALMETTNMEKELQEVYSKINIIMEDFVMKIDKKLEELESEEA